MKDEGQEEGGRRREDGRSERQCKERDERSCEIRRVLYFSLSVWQVLIAIMITQIAPLRRTYTITHQNSWEVVEENFNVLPVYPLHLFIPTLPVRHFLPRLCFRLFFHRCLFFTPLLLVVTLSLLSPLLPCLLLQFPLTHT